MFNGATIFTMCLLLLQPLVAVVVLIFQCFHFRESIQRFFPLAAL